MQRARMQPDRSYEHVDICFLHNPVFFLLGKLYIVGYMSINDSPKVSKDRVSEILWILVFDALKRHVFNNVLSHFLAEQE